MTPKEKAKKMFDNYFKDVQVVFLQQDIVPLSEVYKSAYRTAQGHAMLAVDEIISACEYIRKQAPDLYWLRESLEYWTKVKRHLEQI